MIPNPIHKVLSTFRSCGVRALLMGGQACVFYGAAEFSRDTPERALFWLREARTPGLLVELARQFPLEAAALAAGPRPLLHAALRGDEAGLESGLAEEERAKRAADRTYWIALKQELERMRHA